MWWQWGVRHGVDSVARLSAVVRSPHRADGIQASAGLNNCSDSADLGAKKGSYGLPGNPPARGTQGTAYGSVAVPIGTGPAVDRSGPRALHPVQTGCVRYERPGSRARRAAPVAWTT